MRKPSEEEEAMLSSKQAVATLGVADLDVARKFYEGKLGLTPAKRNQKGSVTYPTGQSSLFVYVSGFAGTNQATAVSWPVGADLEAVVADLKARGVTFEHYDLPGMRREGDFHLMGRAKIAWFKDPDGNIHAVYR
jgi:catechol 2,3-dioxygenase-like lactoylglutathione lyase family enzyme